MKNRLQQSPGKCIDQEPVYTWPAPSVSSLFYHFPLLGPPWSTLILPFTCIYSFPKYLLSFTQFHNHPQTSYEKFAISMRPMIVLGFFLIINYMVFLLATKFPAEPLKCCTKAVPCNGPSISVLRILVFGTVCLDLCISVHNLLSLLSLSFMLRSYQLDIPKVGTFWFTCGLSGNRVLAA